jgi:hypothetical protein
LYVNHLHRSLVAIGAVEHHQEAANFPCVGQPPFEAEFWLFVIFVSSCSELVFVGTEGHEGNKEIV